MKEDEKLYSELFVIIILYFFENIFAFNVRASVFSEIISSHIALFTFSLKKEKETLTFWKNNSLRITTSAICAFNRVTSRSYAILQGMHVKNTLTGWQHASPAKIRWHSALTHSQCFKTFHFSFLFLALSLALVNCSHLCLVFSHTNFNSHKNEINFIFGTFLSCQNSACLCFGQIVFVLCPLVTCPMHNTRVHWIVYVCEWWIEKKNTKKMIFYGYW